MGLKVWMGGLAMLAAGMMPLAAQVHAPAAQPQAVEAWAPRPAQRPYIEPNRPHTKFADIQARHRGQSDWADVVALTDDFAAAYISMGPGKKTERIFYADDRTFFIVRGGSIRFTIEGQEPFIATKGFLVQVPPLVPFQLETVGDQPALHFEVRPTTRPAYPITETPKPIPGVEYVRASIRAKGGYDDVNRPYLDFEKDIVRDGKAPPRNFIRDPYFQVEMFRGAPVPTPPPTEIGQFRADHPGFWFVLEGQEQFLLEGVPLFTAQEGDVVFKPTGRWHRVNATGTATATRLAINARPGNLHWYPPLTKGK
jgi:mannose-6-phosphate isomerase-like protein (cupin superfamily)